jgi:hypothetical protein
MINLTTVRRVLNDAQVLIEGLDGRELDETDAVTSQSRGIERKKRAQMSQDLQMLATRLELAASLVRVEYWHARGADDPVCPERHD